MREILHLLSQTVRQWNAHRVPRMGAALSFYTVLSLAPLAICMLRLLSLACERKAASRQIVDQVRDMVGPQGADMVQLILNKAPVSAASPWETVIGFAVLLVGASGMFGELQDSLNQIWDVPPRPHPIYVIIKERAMSFAMVLVIGLLMLFSFL